MQQVDEEFEASIAQIFEIDKVKRDDVISFDESIEGEEARTNNDQFGDGSARAKAQNDYVDEEYPASACVLHLNRCKFISSIIMIN